VNHRRWRRVLASFVFAVTAGTLAHARGDVDVGPPADEAWSVHAAPDAHVIVDDYLVGATPEEAAEGLLFCESVPGCQAIWQKDVGTVLILRPIPVPTGDVGDPAPPALLSPSSD